MCGIIGYLNKTGTKNQTLGKTLLAMLNALGCRGPDSAGVALFGPSRPNQLIARVKIAGNGEGAKRALKIKMLAKRFGAEGFAQNNDYLRFVFQETGDLKPFISSIEGAARDVEIVSVGRRLEIIKQVGSPARLEESFAVSGLQGSHGIGHTRLSTESIVDLSHSQPFWAHGCRDLAIVHNGHITNYHQLRRRYQERGIRFYTENDSEIVAVFLGDKLMHGASLRDAMESMVIELDGSFSCLVATDSAMGFVKDSFSLKPLLFTETENFVAVATEEFAIRQAISGDYEVREGQAKEVQVWQK